MQFNEFHQKTAAPPAVLPSRHAMGRKFAQVGNSVSTNQHGQVAYALRGADVLEALPAEEMNAWVGQRLYIQFEGQIHCR